MKKLMLALMFGLNIIFFSPSELNAQCAMCRATVESSTKNEGGVGKGINTGILYLMVIPYIMAAGIGYFWYKHSKRETSRLNKIEDVLKRRLT